MTASRVALFVAVRIRKSVRSRWSSTHALPPENAMSAGPSPTRIRATTLFFVGETRTMRAAWSSAIHTEPAPIQMLYGAAA